MGGDDAPLGSRSPRAAVRATAPLGGEAALAGMAGNPSLDPPIHPKSEPAVSAAVRPHYGAFTISVRPPSAAEARPEAAGMYGHGAAPARGGSPAPMPQSGSLAVSQPPPVPQSTTAVGMQQAPAGGNGGGSYGGVYGGYNSPHAVSAPPSEDDEPEYSDEDAPLSAAELAEVAALLAIAQSRLPVSTPCADIVSVFEGLAGHHADGPAGEHVLFYPVSTSCCYIGALLSSLTNPSADGCPAGHYAEPRAGNL